MLISQLLNGVVAFFVGLSDDSILTPNSCKAIVARKTVIGGRDDDGKQQDPIHVTFERLD